jgi:hypothetical protein
VEGRIEIWDKAKVLVLPELKYGIHDKLHRMCSCSLSSHHGAACRISPDIKASVILGEWARTARSVWRLASGWTARGTIPGGDEIFRTRPDWPCSPPSLLYKGYWDLPPGKTAGPQG